LAFFNSQVDQRQCNLQEYKETFKTSSEKRDECYADTLLHQVIKPVWSLLQEVDYIDSVVQLISYCHQLTLFHHELNNLQHIMQVIETGFLVVNRGGVFIFEHVLYWAIEYFRIIVLQVAATHEPVLLMRDLNHRSQQLSD